MMEDPENQARLDSLKDWNDENREIEVYQLFCENGYGKDFESFKIELRAFLNSDEIVKIFESDGNELPEEALESVAGGFGVKHAVITGLTSLVLACTGAVTLAPVISNLDKANDASVSSEIKDNNGGDAGSRFGDWDRNSDKKQKDPEKGPGGGGLKDLNRSDRKESDLKNKKSKRGGFRGQAKERIFREAQKRRSPRGGGPVGDPAGGSEVGIHRFDDLAKQKRSQPAFSFKDGGVDAKAHNGRKDDNKNNAQNVNNKAKGDIDNKNSQIPPPPPPPPVVPHINGANANVNAPQKSMAQEIAEKKLELDKKRADKKNNVQVNVNNKAKGDIDNKALKKDNVVGNAEAKPKLTLKQIAEKFGGVEGNDRLNRSMMSLGRKNNDLSNEASQSILEDSNLSLGFGKENMAQRRLGLIANKIKGLGGDDAAKFNFSSDDMLMGDKNFKRLFLDSEESFLDSEESFVGNRSMSNMHNKAHGGGLVDLNSSKIDKSGESKDLGYDDFKGDFSLSDVPLSESQNLSNEGSQPILSEHSVLKFDSLSDSFQKDDGSLEDSNLSLGFGKENMAQRRLGLIANKIKGLGGDDAAKFNFSSDDMLMGDKNFKRLFLDSEESFLDSEESFVGNRSMSNMHNKAHGDNLFDLNLSKIDKSDESGNIDGDDVLNFTFADLGDKNKNKNNNSQNAQNVNNEAKGDINNNNPQIPPPPPPPPPPPVVPQINGANANVNAPQKSPSQEIAEKKLELDKKRDDKKNNEENNKLKRVKDLAKKVLVSKGKAEIRKAVEELIKEVEKNEKKHLTMEELQKEAGKVLTNEEGLSVAVKIRNYFLNVHEDVNNADSENDDDWD